VPSLILSSPCISASAGVHNFWKFFCPEIQFVLKGNSGTAQAAPEDKPWRDKSHNPGDISPE